LFSSSDSAFLAGLGTVGGHVARTPVAPPVARPGLTGTLAVLTARPTLVTGLGAVDRHPAGVPRVLALSIAGPPLAPLVVVLAARLRCGGRLCCGTETPFPTWG